MPLLQYYICKLFFDIVTIPLNADDEPGYELFYAFLRVVSRQPLCPLLHLPLHLLVLLISGVYSATQGSPPWSFVGVTLLPGLDSIQLLLVFELI